MKISPNSISSIATVAILLCAGCARHGARAGHHPSDGKTCRGLVGARPPSGPANGGVIMAPQPYGGGGTYVAIQVIYSPQTDKTAHPTNWKKLLHPSTDPGGSSTPVSHGTVYPVFTGASPATKTYDLYFYPTVTGDTFTPKPVVVTVCPNQTTQVIIGYPPVSPPQ